MLVTLFLESRLVAPSPTPPPHEREGRGGGNRDVDQSSLFRSGPIGMQFLQGDLVEPVGDRLQVLRDSGERVRSLKATLVHVQCAIDFELNRMEAGGRIAI